MQHMEIRTGLGQAQKSSDKNIADFDFPKACDIFVCCENPIYARQPSAYPSRIHGPGSYVHQKIVPVFPR